MGAWYRRLLEASSKNSPSHKSLKCGLGKSVGSTAESWTRCFGVVAAVGSFSLPLIGWLMEQ